MSVEYTKTVVHAATAPAARSGRALFLPRMRSAIAFGHNQWQGEVATKVEFSGLRRLIRQEEADIPQAGAILVKGNGRRRRILVVTNKEKKRWIFPKGSVKKKETPEQAAEREAEEESGVRGHVVAYVGATEYEEDGELIRVDYFLLAATSESKMLEDRDRRWCKPDELLDLIDTPEVLALLRIALPEIKLFPIES